MNKFRSLVVTVGVAILGTQIPVGAEVSAETDSLGNYLRTVVFSNSSTRNTRIWAVQREKLGFTPLNRDGDANGDMWPLIADQTVGEIKPWVVWSRFNGADYDLAWSTFRLGAWKGIQWVEPAPTSGGDDLDPHIAFDHEGRTYLVWWRNEGGRGRVYLTLFLVTKWMVAYPVSDAEVDSLHPSVTLLPDGKIEVSYDTPRGRVTRVIAFTRPATITDDVTPFGRMTVTEERNSDNLTN